MARISEGLDGIQSELRVAQSLLTQYAKRIFTDRIFIALAALVVAGIVAIIVYATVKPDQQVFRVPDAVKPPTAR